MLKESQCGEPGGDRFGSGKLMNDSFAVKRRGWEKTNHRGRVAVPSKLGGVGCFLCPLTHRDVWPRDIDEKEDGGIYQQRESNVGPPTVKRDGWGLGRKMPPARASL